MATPAQNQASTHVLPPQIDRTDLKALEAVATASIPPAEAYFVVRGLLQKDSGAEVLEATYEALRSVVFQFVAGRVLGEQLDRWGDVVLRVKQLFRSRSDTLAERFTVLSDFLEQASRFAEFQPTDDLRRRRHVKDVLQILASSDHPVERARIVELTGLKEANLSRVLGNLTSIGWVERSPAGREVLVSITPQGRRDGLGETHVEEPRHGPFESTSALEILRLVWGQSGASIAMSRAGAGIVACDVKFASLLGFASTSDVVGQSSVVIRQRLSEMSVGSDEIAPDEVTLEDGSCHRVVEHTIGESSLWVGFDVTPYKQRIEAYARREAVLLAEMNGLRRQAQAASAVSHVPVAPSTFVGAVDLASYMGAIRNDLLFPITTINNAGHQMRQAFQNPTFRKDQFIEQIESVLRESERVRNTLRDLLYVGGTPRVAVTAFAPSAVVRDVTESLVYTGRSLDQSFELQTEFDEEVETDELLFRSTLRNALAGVMQMTKSGGKIAIATQKEDDFILLLVKSASAAYDMDPIFGSPLNNFTLCRHVVSRIGGQCELSSSSKGVTAKISVPIMGKVADAW